MKKSLGAKPIVCPTPVYIVGTYDEEGKPNMMAVAWGGICCSQPPCVAVSLRKATYSYENIVKNEAFTVNIPSVSQMKEADYVGIYSGRKEDKFAATGLTAVKSELVNAPFIEEFPLVIECKLLHTLEIGLHTQFIGEICDVKAEKDVLDDFGRVDVEKLDPFIFNPGNQGYYSIGALAGQAFSIG